ncbi:MAG: hypothetical protein C4308_01475 [Chitinophagaceae bacterium]
MLAFCVVSCTNSVKGPNGVVYKSAQEYNDYIINRQTEILKQILAFSDAAQYNVDSAELLLNKSIGTISKSIEDINGMSAYKGDTSLRNAAVNSFAFYKRIFSNEYKQILDIRRRPQLTEQDVQAIQQIVDKISNEEKAYDERFQKAQARFARDNHMQMKENEMQKGD